MSVSSRPLIVKDTDYYFELVDRNREHLTQHGDYPEVKEATLESISRELTDPANLNLKLGFWLHDSLVGRIDLSLRARGPYVIGYWLASEHTATGSLYVAIPRIFQEKPGRTAE